MKKTINIILTFALLSALALTAGCKKTQTEQKTVNVTFVAEGNAKTTISPRGVVEFIPGDQIHVFDANYGYLGYLDYQHAGSAKGGPATFYGALKQWNDNTTLRFIHMPGYKYMTKIVASGYNQNESAFYYVSLADQTYEGEQSPENDLDNIAQHFLVSKYEEQNVPADKLEYTGHLTSVMSILALNTSEFDDGTNVKIFPSFGYNYIKISEQGAISYAYAGGGAGASHLVTGPGQELRYVAVLPNGTPATLNITSNAKEGSLKMTAPIAVNTLITDYKNTTITATPVSDESYVDMAPATKSDGTPSEFTVNSSGKKVKIATGNLVYDHGRFKMHKTPYATSLHNGDDWSTYNYNNAHDGFHWASSGWDNGNLYYMPWGSYDSHDYGYGMGPRDASGNYYDMTGTYKKADWGVYQFGMNTGEEWRTLTIDELNFLLTGRKNNNITSRSFALGTYNGQKGLIIFPDDFNATLSGSYKYNTTTGNNLYVNISADDWSAMEAAGAVFLLSNKYWTSSGFNDHLCWYLSISPYGNNLVSVTGREREHLHAVRLVSDVN